jgi:hypothetical protein
MEGVGPSGSRPAEHAGGAGVSEAVSFNNTWKAVITLATLLFNAAIIILVLWKGEPNNSLHASAMAWGFATDGLILAGLGIGAVTPDIISAIGKR